MPRVTRSARPQDEALPGMGTGRRVGRTERGVNESIKAARKQNSILATDAALVGLARVLARACDIGEVKHNAYAMAIAGKELRATLGDLGLIRGTGTDDSLDWLTDIGAPERAGVSNTG